MTIFFITVSHWTLGWMGLTLLSLLDPRLWATVNLPLVIVRGSYFSLFPDGVQPLLGALLCRGAPAQVPAVRALLLPAMPAAAAEQGVPQGRQGR